MAHSCVYVLGVENYLWLNNVNSGFRVISVCVYEVMMKYLWLNLVLQHVLLGVDKVQRWSIRTLTIAKQGNRLLFIHLLQGFMTPLMLARMRRVFRGKKYSEIIKILKKGVPAGE